MSAITRPLLVGVFVASAAAIAIGYAGGDAAPLPAPPAIAADGRAAPASTPARKAPIDLHHAVSDATMWPLPADARLPGFAGSRLAPSLDDWIATLPAADQERARRYTARYAPAYEIGDKAVQAWLLDRGFPSLEEFAAFDYARDAAGCPASDCANPKIAALSADHFIAQMEQALPAPDAAGRRSMDGLDDGARRAAAQSYVQAGLYVDRVRRSGNVLFAAYLDMRREQAFGHDSRVAASRLFIAACGDARMSLDPGQTVLAGALLQNAYGSPCNNAGKSAFPTTDAALAARP
jgi:hypothetical protein